VADALLGLGWALCDQGRHAEAEPLLERALGLYERAFGPEHPSVAEALMGLGVARLGRGRAAEAEVELSRAVEILARRGLETDETTEAAALLERARAARAGE
jgi:Tfp pilus assembly protein PilF